MGMQGNMQGMALGALLAAGQAAAGVDGSVGIPNTSGGVVVSCSNPHRLLTVMRRDEATRVLQTGPDGANWQVELPPMQERYDQYWLAPDGSAAVVAVSQRANGSAFLVTGQSAAIEIPDAVAAVDYQKNRVLVASVSDRGVRVRVYDVRTGALVGDTSFDDVVQVNADLAFHVRLTGDGRTYYYVQQSVAGGPGGPVLRDVVSGEKRMPKMTLPDGSRPGGSIYDMRMYSSSRGYVSLDARLYAFSEQGLVRVPVDDAVGDVYRIVDSPLAHRQPVEGPDGWGVLDVQTGRWLIAERGMGVSLHPSGTALVAVNQHKDRPGVRAYDISGPRARLTRSFDGSAAKPATRQCANAYGLMAFEEGRFKWHRMVEQP